MRKVCRWISKALRIGQPTYGYSYVDDIPKKVRDKSIYIIGMRDEPWSILFTCPCGCKSEIMLNALAEGKPRWRYNVADDKVSISPSINRIVGCKSHFVVRKGEIKWC
jgi:hypothetical protein